MASTDYGKMSEEHRQAIEARLLKKLMFLPAFRKFLPDYPKLNRFQKVRRLVYRLFRRGDPYKPVPKLPNPTGDPIKFRRLKPIIEGQVPRPSIFYEQPEERGEAGVSREKPSPRKPRMRGILWRP